MANINKFIPFLLKWEGGYVNDPDDSGGPTNKGVSLKTWQDCGYDKNGDSVIDEDDLKQIFFQDLVECVLRPHYWNRWQADRIRNQLFDRFNAERAAYIERICIAHPANRRFKKGWLNRLNDIKFAYVMLVFFLAACLPGCKSATSSKSLRMETATVAELEKESEERMKTQWNRIFSRQAESEANTETVIETFTVRFGHFFVNSRMVFQAKNRRFFSLKQKYSPAVVVV